MGGEGKCVLDCVFSKALNMLFVIDMLEWGEQSFIKMPTALRLQFLSQYLTPIQSQESPITLLLLPW